MIVKKNNILYLTPLYFDLSKLQIKVSGELRKLKTGCFQSEAKDCSLPRTWILIADTTLVRLFIKAHNAFDLIGEIEPVSAYRKHNDIPCNQDELMLFSEELAKLLDFFCKKDMFDNLVLSATDEMLEAISISFSDKTKSYMIVESIDDETGLSEGNEIQKKIKEIIWF